jgi:hypothetical protein
MLAPHSHYVISGTTISNIKYIRIKIIGRARPKLNYTIPMMNNNCLMKPLSVKLQRDKYPIKRTKSERRNNKSKENQRQLTLGK